MGAVSDNFAKAKTAVASYDTLWDRTQKLDDSATRDALAGKYHSAGDNPESPLYLRNSLAYRITASESVKAGVDYAPFDAEAVKAQIAKLEASVAEWRPLVDNAEEDFGVLPEPAPVTPSEVTPIAAPKSSLALEVGLGIAAVIAFMVGFVIE